MILELSTSPQGHQFDPRMTPWAPKVPPLGHDLGDRIKSENTHKVWYKNL